MITIYGASDDLVEIEADDGDEVGAYEQDVIVDIGQREAGAGKDASGLEVRMHYGDGGVWTATLSQFDEDVAIPWPVSIRSGAPSRGYSVVVAIDCPSSTRVKWRCVKSVEPAR